MQSASVALPPVSWPLTVSTFLEHFRQYLCRWEESLERKSERIPARRALRPDRVCDRRFGGALCGGSARGRRPRTADRRAPSPSPDRSFSAGSGAQRAGAGAAPRAAHRSLRADSGAYSPGRLACPGANTRASDRPFSPGSAACAARLSAASNTRAFAAGRYNAADSAKPDRPFATYQALGCAGRKALIAQTQPSGGID